MSKSINSCPNRHLTITNIIDNFAELTPLLKGLHSIFKFKLFFQKSRYYLFACSGGVDSMAATVILIDYLLGIGVERKYCIILHFHHAQRKASDFEYTILKNFFFGYTVVSATFLSKGKCSTEMILRKARRNFFRSVLSQYDDVAIILGHHKVDSIITMMLNQQRGSGFFGVQGLSQYEHRVTYGLEYKIIRPLLGLTKDQIYNLAKTYKIPYREDISNFEAKNSRSILYYNYLQYLGEDDLHFFDSSCFSLPSISTNISQHIITVISKNNNSISYLGYIENYALVFDSNPIGFVYNLLKYMEGYHHMNKQIFSELLLFFDSKGGGNYYHQGVYYWKHQSKLYIIKCNTHFWNNNLLPLICDGDVFIGQFRYNIFVKNSTLTYGVVVLDTTSTNIHHFGFSRFSDVSIQELGFPLSFEDATKDGWSISSLQHNFKGKNTTLFKFLSKCGIPFFMKPYCCVIYKCGIPCFVLFPVWVCR